MPAILIATIKITNPAKLAEYREHAGAAIAKHHGKPIGAGPLEPVEGPGLDKSIAALFEFPDLSAIKAWIDDPDLASIHALRNQAGVSDIVAIELP